MLGTLFRRMSESLSVRERRNWLQRARLTLEQLDRRDVPAIFYVTVTTDTPNNPQQGELRDAINLAGLDSVVNPGALEIIDMTEVSGTIALQAALPDIDFFFRMDGPGQGERIKLQPACWLRPRLPRGIVRPGPRFCACERCCPCAGAV